MKFGEKLTVYKGLVRVALMKQHKGQYGPWKRRHKEWNEKLLVEGETEVVFLGTRTLSNGVTHWESECGYLYMPEHHFKAWFVCAENRKPFYILPQE